MKKIKIKVKKSELVYQEIKKRYLIDYKDRKIEIEKWISNYSNPTDYDDGWDFTYKKDKLYFFETLYPYEREVFSDFVDKLNLYDDDIRG